MLLIRTIEGGRRDGGGRASGIAAAALLIRRGRPYGSFDDGVAPPGDALEVGAEQQDYVARNTYSLAQAFVEPRAWVRAVYADEEPVGFMMVRIDGGKNEFFLWRFMIAAAHQGKGYGRRALELLVDEVRRRGGSELVSSYGLGEHGPAGFYHAFGFVDTGEVAHQEAVIKLQL